MENDNIILCCNTCIYNNGKCLVYGQYKNINIKKTLYKIINDENTLLKFIWTKKNDNFNEKNNIKKFKLVFAKKKTDFYLILDEKLDNLKDKKCIFIFNQLIMEYQLKFPFENVLINLNVNKSAFISTMIQNYSNRIEEWIKYHLKLGFSGIILFENRSKNKDFLKTTNIVNKYKNKVVLINFPYKPFSRKHWNNIQRLTLSVGVNAFKNKCKFISLTDADEFIYIPKNHQKLTIEDFLSKYRHTICMSSNILTNKYRNEKFNNNILEKAIYLGKEMYTKIIIHTNDVKNDRFVITPHEYKYQKVICKSRLIHYHIWMNERYKFNYSMQKTFRLFNFNK